ncbi:MAG: serine/threonine protein kinase [Bradymonadia bacterium]
MRYGLASEGHQALSSPCDLHRLEGHVIDGRYRVLRTIHAGPRTVTYEVEPPGVGTTRRALKVFTLPEAREPEAMERLATHVEVVRTLDCPDLERSYSHGRLMDETPYLITEWLPFTSLGKAVQGGVRLPAGVALPLIIRVAEAVGALHERGLCHGDIRIQHVLWSGADLEVVKIIDGGITAAFRPPPVSAASPYLAPERFMGQPPGPAADVYALAVLAWRLRTGRYPFEPRDERAEEAGLDPVARLQWLHHHANPPHPQDMAPDDEWPGAVDAVLIQALAKSPGARFVHAGVFAQALKEAIHSPTPVPVDSMNELQAAHEAAAEASIRESGALGPLDETPPVVLPPYREVPWGQGELQVSLADDGHAQAEPESEEAPAQADVEIHREHTPEPWSAGSGWVERMKWPLLAVGIALGTVLALSI